MVEIAPKAVLLDGPMAGFLRNVPRDWISLHVLVPKLANWWQPSPDFGGCGQEAAIYAISTRRVSILDDDGARLITIQVGTHAPGDPPAALLDEMIPTALAEQGLIHWASVADTARDRTQPVALQSFGDPTAPCTVRVQDPSWLPLDYIDATCACGWHTEPVLLERRSQLVRAAGKHVAQQWERRDRYHRPIRVVDQGSGLTDTCLGSWRFDADTQTIHALCRECGWRTEDVEPYRGKPLERLWATHAEPDGLPAFNDRLQAAFGLPPVEDGAEDA